MANLQDAGNNQPPKPWWRFPMVWLVISGPLLVVIASFFTLGLALKYPDPVLTGSSGESGGSASSSSSSTANLPAIQARNHAATGGK